MTTRYMVVATYAIYDTKSAEYVEEGYDTEEAAWERVLELTEEEEK